MSSYPSAPSFSRPLPRVPVPGTNDAANFYLRERGRPAGGDAESSIAPSSAAADMHAYPLQTLYGRAPQSIFSADAGDDGGKSINGFDDDVQQFTGLGGLSSVAGTSGRARALAAPAFQDRTRTAASQADEALAASPKRRSRTCLWVTAGALAAVAAVATGLGVHFAMAHNSTSVTSGNAAGAAVGSSSTTPAPTTASSSSASVQPSTTASLPFSIASSTILSSSSVQTSTVFTSSFFSSSSTPVVLSSSTTSPVALPSATAAAGVLENGIYSLSYTKQTDACNSMDFVCNAQVTDGWTVSTTGSTYNVFTARGKTTSNVGAPTTSNVLSFGLPGLTALEANNCTYSVTFGFSLNLMSQTFTGESTWRRTLIDACTDNKGRLLPAGDTCDCQYSVSGSVVP